MNAYPFLVLDLVLLIPVVLVWFARRDLRRAMLIMAAIAIPFGFTEFLFYPTYWAPPTLFDLANRIGFCIEDFLFVAPLGAFTTVAYPFVTRRKFVPNRKRDLRVMAGILAVTFLSVVIFAVVEIPMIYGSVIIMWIATAALCAIRRDLLIPALIGSIVTTVVYTGVCLILAGLIPEVFELNWNADKFSGISIASIPLEELLYASAAGAIATCFYPFVFGLSFEPIHRESSQT